MSTMKELPPNPYNAFSWFIGDPEIGDNCWIGAFVMIDGSGGLKIGKGCEIGNCTQIVTHSTARRTVTARAYPHVDRSPIEIGDHVFIGPNVTILLGSKIGSHSIVAAGAVVTEGSEFPPYSLIAGVPALRKGDVRWSPQDP